MSTPEIRPATEADLPFVTEIYEHAVRYGTATFELIPPDLAEMTRRFRALMDGGFPYFVAALEGRVVGYAYAGPYRPRPAYRFTVENSVYLAAGDPPPRHRPVADAAADRRMRGARLPADDRGDRRFRQCRLDRRPHQDRLPDDRNPSQCRPEIRPLARHRDDAARARRGRGDGAGGRKLRSLGMERKSEPGITSRCAKRMPRIALRLAILRTQRCATSTR